MKNYNFRRMGILIFFLWGLIGTGTGNLAAQVTFDPKTTLFLEAESAVETKTLGGWSLDQQFMDQIGSAVLLAHGLGEPVADAEITAHFPVTGDYRVFVRTRNWTALCSSEEGAGPFTVSIDHEELPTIFGTDGSEWAWQEGGTVSVSAGEHQIALHDLTGFDGRVDALCFSTDPDFFPPNDKSGLTLFRRSALNLPETIPDVRETPFDLVVVGGGTAGICSAVSAARLGLDVALIQNRFLLGGNNSSEIRVHLQGQMNLPPYPNLGNLVYQFQPAREGNAEPAENYEDAKKLDFVRTEKNVSLFLGTHLFGVEKEGDRITAVLAKDVVTGRERRFKGRLFADCSGDGNLGYLAGADWRMGRESKEETGETTAPDKADDMTMGASIQWYAVETDAPTAFPDLAWAVRFTSESIRPAIHGDWDWETGLNWDQVADLEKIRDHGLRAAYGHWSFMKNHITDDAWRDRVKTMKLGWVAYTAGKRESRRLMGDVVLKEQDITNGTAWPDETVTTTWAIDLHYPDPDNTKFFPGEEFRAICKTIDSPPYAIPYRCFYSRNIANLFMAGRDISVTHAALGTVRVMRTGGMMGEVVGMAASVCKKHDALPRDVYEKYFEELRALMTVGVAPPVPGQMTLAVPTWAKDLQNLALRAAVSASSESVEGESSVKRINDGKIDPSDAAGLFVTKPEREHWVRFDFSEPTEVNGLHFVSDNTQSPARNFYLFQRLDENGLWQDVPGSFIKNRRGHDFALTFPTVCAKSFRLRYALYYDKETLRLWEVELYRRAE